MTLDCTRPPAVLNTISCARQTRCFNREWNEHPTMRQTGLFSSACQDIAICGYNASPSTVCVSPINLTGSLQLIPLVMLRPNTAAFVEKAVTLTAGIQSVRLRPGVGGHAWNADKVERGGQQGGRVCYYMNGVIELFGACLAWPLAQDHSSMWEGRGARAPPSSAALYPSVEESIKTPDQ